MDTREHFGKSTQKEQSDKSSGEESDTEDHSVMQTRAKHS